MSGVAPGDAMTASAIAVRGLVKRYGGRAVVDGLDLQVRPGELVALLGPNGAGKTTTVETIEGYRRPDGGEVRVLGLDPWREGAALRGRVGLMLQGGGIQPLATPRELLRLYAGFHADPEAPDALLERVGLAEAAGTRYRVLSGGQRQRLSLALALVGRPELLLLDEPTAGMDPAAKAATRALIGDLRAGGTTILLTTHELADVERLADRVVVVDRGRVVANGSVAELTGGGRGTFRFRPAAPLEPADAHLLGAVEDRGGWYEIAGVEASPAAVARLATWAAERGLLIAELRAGSASLEERYLELTGERGEDEA